MIKTVDITLSPIAASDSKLRLIEIARTLGTKSAHITSARIRKRSIDGRSKEVRIRLRVEVFIDEPAPEEEKFIPNYKPLSPSAKKVIVVGSGPAGLFAALTLIEHGIKPIVLERGKDVQQRRFDLAAIQRKGIVNPDSNYCFGEGGAGTYSDGKLYTRSTKRGDVTAALRTLVAHGSSPDILIDAHPHIGSNKLPKVVSAMRNSVIGAGGEIHFETPVSDLLVKNKKIIGVVTRDGKEFLGEAVILATGHSARDIFNLLAEKNIRIEAKPFAMGVRVEHPQSLIDQDQYHCTTRDVHLPAASYKLAIQSDGRGVFSFCMCPGGFIIPAATSPGELVLNGMSLSKRDSPFANSGVVVAINDEDLAPFASYGAFAGIKYQSLLERTAFETGGRSQAAPAQRLTDFIRGRLSSTLPNTSYQPGTVSAELGTLLPKAISKRLQEGFIEFGKKIHGYVTEEAVVLGVETRTSSPIHIPRNSETLEHPEISGLYPCGEGAGYAGGIISAALDGVNVSETIAKKIK